MNIDFTVRRSAALWAQGVSVEAPETVDHAARVVLAKRICQDIAPREGGLDILANLILLTRIFVGEGDVEDAAATAMLEIILGVFVKVGAFQ
jgi:hypothetical protein